MPHCYSTYLLFLLSILLVQGLRKVIVPAVYKEFEKGLPSWITDEEFKVTKGYEVYLYQRLYPEQPNYVRNRGTEGTVYLRYIVDHYDNFPDIAVFVHADPKDHQPHWLELVECIQPNATYSDLNFIYFTRSPTVWQNLGIWMEQCWRDTLKLIYNETDDAHYLRFPVKKPLEVTFPCCQQFFVSRAQIHRRPYSFWKTLLHIFNEQDVCHVGEPNYAQLHAYVYESPNTVGPEPTEIPFYIMNNRHFHGDRPNEGYGRYMQGLTLEHFAHMIYGGLDIHASKPTQEFLCTQFFSADFAQCPHSPCKQQSTRIEGNVKEPSQSTTAIHYGDNGSKFFAAVTSGSAMHSGNTPPQENQSKKHHGGSIPTYSINRTSTSALSSSASSSPLSSSTALHSSVPMFRPHHVDYHHTIVDGQQQQQQHPIHRHIHAQHDQKNSASRYSTYLGRRRAYLRSSAVDD